MYVCMYVRISEQPCRQGGRMIMELSISLLHLYVRGGGCAPRTQTNPSALKISIDLLHACHSDFFIGKKPNTNQVRPIVRHYNKYHRLVRSDACQLNAAAGGVCLPYAAGIPTYRRIIIVYVEVIARAGSIREAIPSKKKGAKKFVSQDKSHLATTGFTPSQHPMCVL